MIQLSFASIIKAWCWPFLNFPTRKSQQSVEGESSINDTADDAITKFVRIKALFEYGNFAVQVCNRDILFVSTTLDNHVIWFVRNNPVCVSIVSRMKFKPVINDCDLITSTTGGHPDWFSKPYWISAVFDSQPIYPWISLAYKLTLVKQTVCAMEGWERHWTEGSVI